MKISKTLYSLFLSLFFLSLFACSTSNSNVTNQTDNKDDENSNSSETSNQKTSILTGKEAFMPDYSSNFEVIFFDTDNVISSDGKSYKNVISDLGSNNKTNNCSDCYMIKCGDTEILVDCGNQIQYGSNDNRVRNFCTNIIRKLLTYCSDGVLDYLIVTHADFDHIENLVIDGGLFDMILDYDSWFTKYYCIYNNSDTLKNIFDEDVIPITTISNIVDFDSYRVRKNSSKDNGNENLLISSEIYKDYSLKRDKVIDKCNSAYSTAGSFFDSITGDTTDSSYHNYYAMPYYYYNLVYEKTNGKGLEPNLRTILNDKIKNSYTNKEYQNVVSGNLHKISTQNGNRYTYDIDLKNSTKLRILYNWFYDSYYNHTFNSQDRNNLSVSLIVESGNSKLLLLGDLGGNGESGLLRYYTGTDVINDVSCFKLSHHGSTNNGENSADLFSMICNGTSEIVLTVTGVAQASRSFYECQDAITDNQKMYDSLSGVAVLDKKLFNNINSNFKLLCTQIVKTDDNSGFYNQPFYGDIHISFTSSNRKIMYSYSGEISTYVLKVDNDIEKTRYKFFTYNEKDFVSIQYLEWFAKVGLK